MDAEWAKAGVIFAIFADFYGTKSNTKNILYYNIH